MANAIYPKYKQALLAADANVDLVAGTVKAALIDTGVYTYSAAHDFFDDVTGQVGSSVTLSTGKTDTDGLFDADDITFTSVSGNTIEALILYIDTGTPATSRLVAYWDTGITEFPITPNGGDIDILWNASGIFQL